MFWRSQRDRLGELPLTVLKKADSLVMDAKNDQTLTEEERSRVFQ